MGDDEAHTAGFLLATLIFMPSGLKRFHHSGQSHFVTFTCYHRLPHLADDKTCQAFVIALERARRFYQFRVYGFVAMPEHAHLLISEPESGTIAKAVQSLKISSSLRTSKARDCSKGRFPLWQKRYYDRNIRDYAEFVEKLQYLHRNPVKSGLVERRSRRFTPLVMDATICSGKSDGSFDIAMSSASGALSRSSSTMD